MADYIDSFVDTREKRSLLMRLLCWFGWMIVCALALYTASRLIMVNDYAGLFGLLDDERMSWFAISRMVLQAMSIAQGTWWDYLSTALSALSLWEWALLLLSLFFAYGSRRIWKYAVLAFVQLLYFLAVGVLFLLALRSSSLQEVIVVLRMIGMLSAVVYLVLWLVVLLQCMGTLQRYRCALLVHPIEVSGGEDGEDQA
mgnify:FL=1